MKRCFGLCVLGVVLLSSQSTPAQNLQLRTHGFGRAPCSVWSEARANRNEAIDPRVMQGHEWMSGFLSGYNLFLHPLGNVATLTGAEDVNQWLEDYCRDNPSAMFRDAVIKLVEHLRSRVFTGASSPKR